MITVRYPSGFSVQYNGGNYVKYYEGFTRISTANPDTEGKWIADVQASAGAIIEVYTPCRTYDANTVDASKIGEMALEKIRSLSAGTLAKMKDELRMFDARTGRWKS